MVNSIIEAISIALNGEFGDDYKVYADNVEQGLQKPCFFVSCIKHTNKLFLGRRYFRENLFCVKYFPKCQSGEKEECNETAQRLFLCLEWLTVEGELTMGTKMRGEVVDGVLNFFVNYDMFVYRKEEAGPAMEMLTEETTVKGQVRDDS